MCSAKEDGVKMETASMEYIISTVFKTNILPIISECNTACIFCSHKQNPKEVKVYRLPKLNMQDFEEIIEFLSPNKKIVIGEAATRIIEGEPFLFKDIMKLIALIRKKYENTPIQITTNGLLLKEEFVDALERLGNIELNISVNCVDIKKHKEILGLKVEQNIKDRLRLLKGRLKYSGSAVLVPEIMKGKDLEELCEFLNENGAETLRLFIPGYTSLHGDSPNFFELFKEAKELVDDLRKRYSIPIIIEPSVLDNLNCNVEGIIKNSYAALAGIKVGDVLTSVNGNEIGARVAAFDKIFRAYNPKLKLLRNDIPMEVSLLKPKNSYPGFVLLYDIDPNLSHQVKNLIKRYPSENILFITSELAIHILEKYFEKSDFSFNYKIISAPNNFFGGTIKCAGLLILQDILDLLESYLKTNPAPDLIILPPIMFDSKGTDLVGRNLRELESILKIRVEIP